ncbi:MAG: glycosyltransferase family 4 protein [Rikenellaceae bacterium]
MEQTDVHTKNKIKILIVHNNYGTYSGEEAVVDNMLKTYKSLGYKVDQYRESTCKIQDSLHGKIRAFFGGIFPSIFIKKFSAKLQEFNPSIVHIHNLYPFIGPAILKECKMRKIQVIMSVHNYRLICPTGLCLRNNLPCESCTTKQKELSCIRYNCEKSIFKSVGYALRNMVARKRRYYLKYVDKYCCLTNFQRSKLISSGFDSDKIIVIPNSIKSAKFHSQKQGSYIGYCGRLSPEKGIDLILKVARSLPHIEFKFAGSPRPDYQIKNPPKNCEFLGHIAGENLKDFFTNSKFMVMASVCWEGFPMAILEAINFGKCVLAPSHGSFKEICENEGKKLGELFESNNADDLEKKILLLSNNPSLISEYCENGEQAIAQKYSDKVIENQWKTLIENL